MQLLLERGCARTPSSDQGGITEREELSCALALGEGAAIVLKAAT